MAFIHGKGAVVTLDGDDLSAYTNNIEFSREADTHETTTFGRTTKTYGAGLQDGTCTLSGIYDDAAAGPRAQVEPNLGATVTLVYKPEGTGSGKPQDSVSVVVTAYNETAAVGDMVAWTVELQCTGDVTTTDQ